MSEIRTGKSTTKDILIKVAPIIGLAVIIVLFSFITGGKLLDSKNIQTLTNQIIVTALVSIGAVFLFGAGVLDMSLGPCVCIAAILGAKAAKSGADIAVVFLVILATSLVLASAKGIMFSTIKVPIFIVTIVAGTIITAAALAILGSETTILLDSLPKLTASQMATFNIILVGVFFLVCLYFFNFTSLGKSVKMLGGNPRATALTGLSASKVYMLVSVIGGIGVALAAFVILLRTSTASALTGGSIGTDVMVALVLGGMPLSGGPRSKISAGVIGACTFCILNNGLTMTGLTIGNIQIVRGVIFLAVVLITSLSYRTKLLPR
ncbi:MAG: ABC transporter permease [Clostridiales bacterium]|nr:ABC transporter permease [Clostridiales bacterium]